MDKQDQVQEQEQRPFRIVALKSWGYGYKFTLETLYPNGATHRSLACHTSEQGVGLVIAGVTVASTIQWRGLTLQTAHAKLTRLIDDNIGWLKLSSAKKSVA